MTRLRSTGETVAFALRNLVSWYRHGGRAMWHANDVELADMGRMAEEGAL